MRLRLLVAALVTGCGVPNVTFGPDAATDVAVDVATQSSPGLDATDHAAPTSDAAVDSGAPLEATDAGSSDATCPNGVPDGASICCGPVPCKGSASACQGECTNCENDCAGQTCCLDKHGNYAGCAASPSSCP